MRIHTCSKRHSRVVKVIHLFASLFERSSGVLYNVYDPNRSIIAETVTNRCLTRYGYLANILSSILLYLGKYKYVRILHTYLYFVYFHFRFCAGMDTLLYHNTRPVGCL